MATVRMEPVSAGRRGTVRVITEDLHKSTPYTPLLGKKNSTVGRSDNGHITTRRKGGDHKHHYRVVDFKYNKDDIPARVGRIECDPNRTAFITLLCYADDECRYIIAPRSIQTGTVLAPGAEAVIKMGNTLPTRNIPASATIHCIEMRPGKGTQIARSAGASTVLLAKEGAYAQVRLRSDEVRGINVDCRATIGGVGNEEQGLKKIGKAGADRWRGIRPTIRGVVANPVDHPHGGGEGRTGEAHEPVSPWGTPAKGYRTRDNKHTDNMIVRRRYSSKG